MGISKQHVDEHVGDHLSGYIDGELTQQERQRVELHCSQCEECQKLLDELETLRARMGKARLSPMGEDQWRENMSDDFVKASRGIGWVIFIGGAIGLFLMILHALLFDSGLSAIEKLIFFAFYGGLGALLVSVIRQRWVESKDDKYNDVEI